MLSYIENTITLVYSIQEKAKYEPLQAELLKNIRKEVFF